MTVAVALGPAVGACGGSSSHDAVVPAALRDVERDGEGLVNTTFGDTPTGHLPDWARAQGVLVLLKQVWSNTKAGYPKLPATQVQMVDDAVATLDQAIPGMDQRAAAFASNKVGLAVPELFDYFHTGAPIGVVRMDAVFRQVGLDGHYGDLTAVQHDLDSLMADWATTKPSVAASVPTCHRVGGTATVVADIDDSLSRLTAAVPSNDMTAIQTVSDEGALEIDTLELLFDCPKDGPAPASGLGSACSATTACGSGLVCDTAKAGGKCAPDATNKIGTPCTSTNDCGTDSRSACQTEAGDGYRGGYCFMEPCNDVSVCPVGGTCVALGGETPGCFKACTADTDCRTTEGYVCQLFVTTPPIGFGPTDHACAFPCTRDQDCQQPLKCDVASGKCTP
ncbi:MAG TPA: hypothetical protein VGD55_10340 [Acidothermaceae bacterium]